MIALKRIEGVGTLILRFGHMAARNKKYECNPD
jgi:hypothetical protein